MERSSEQIPEEIEEDPVGSDVIDTDEMIQELVQIEEIDDIGQVAQPAEEEAEEAVESSLSVEQMDGAMSFDPMLFVQLGDDVVIDSTAYGRTIGTVYYRSQDRISVKPVGVSNTLHTFETHDEDGEEVYDEADGVRAIYIVKKRVVESFVEQQDFRVDHQIDTFDAQGNAYHSYDIVEVKKDEDAIVIRQIGEEETYLLSFDYTGISSDEPFAVISHRPLIKRDGDGNGDGEELSQEQEEQEVQSHAEEQAEAQEEQEEDEIQVMGEIEITRPTIYVKAESYEQSIPDALQKMAALNDHLSSLTEAERKDPRTLRATRILVELLFELKQATVMYRTDGSVQGVKDVSATTLSELVDRASIPLGRPVLHVTKTLYSPEEEHEEAEYHTEQVHMIDFEEELMRMIAPSKKAVSMASSVGAVQGISKEWYDQQQFMTQFMSPWIPHEKGEPLWRAKEDSEFFRNTPPVCRPDPPCRLADTISGYRASHNVKEPHPILDEIPFGIERALGITYRKGSNRRKQLHLSEESATLQSYLLFPMSAVAEMGSTRTHHLATDSGRSHLPRRTMTQLLETLGDPKEAGTTRDILLFDVTGDTLGNIPLADYIEGITIPSLGVGDAFSVLQHLGMDQMELHADTLHALDLHVSSYQSTLLSTLSTLRTMLSEIPATEPETYLLIENPAVFDILRSELLLVNAMEEYERTNPSLAQSDIGKMAYLLKHHSNYVQVVAGKNNMEIVKAIRNANHENYLENRQTNAILQESEEHAVRPIRNTCSHVADLVRIRREKEDVDRFALFMKFVKRYQGTHDEQWVNCVVCKEHLICIHERLQLQAYLHPTDKHVIEKEILLTCSGGQFQGKYICRICGQTIRELDLDTSLTFDGEGRPVTGRAVLVDDDAEMEDMLDLLVAAPVEAAPVVHLSPEELPCYHVLRDMVEYIGIPVTEDAYMKMIWAVMDYLQVYEAEERATRTPVTDARHLIMSAAVILLIEIQTHVPSYVIRTVLPDCPVPEKGSPFHGYPLVEDKSHRQGMEYMACAISSMKNNTTVWSRTGFLTMDIKKRRKGTLVFMEQILEKILPDVVIQARLYEKRQEKVELHTHDQISSTFLPEQLILSPADAAQDAITPEVARMTGNAGKRALVTLWIRQAHHHARESALLIRGSVFSETSCCVAPLFQPGEGWKSGAFHGDLPMRALQPLHQGQMLLTHFIPRPLDNDVVDPDADLYYRLFLKYCFQGDRMGHAHELNLLNVCTWCGFEFPKHPSIMDTDTEGKAALSTQSVVTGTAEFTALLDTIHRVNHVTPPSYSMGWKTILLQMANKMSTLEVQAPRDEIIQAMTAHLERSEASPFPNDHGSGSDDWKGILAEAITQVTTQDLRVSRSDIISVVETILIMNQFGAVQPPPLMEWQSVLSETTARMLRLPPDAERDDIVVAMGPLSDLSVASEALVTKQCQTFRLQQALPLLKNIAGLPWVAFFQVIQSYLIVPLQRMLSGFTDDALFFSYELRQELSMIHITEDLEPILVRERKLQSQLRDELPEVTVDKIQYLIHQLRAMLSYSSTIRPMSVPGREQTLAYLQRAILYGPLAMLLSPSLQDAIQSATDSSSEHLARIIAYLLAKYNKERISYNEQELKNKIAIRDEKERVNIVAEFNTLSDEERAMALMNKRLGMGKWSVGGTKLIYAYDKEYYDQEREKRLHAGIMDDMGDMDDMGYGEGDEPFEEEGYDNNQHGDDDYE
jgi:hypothetical protein